MDSLWCHHYQAAARAIANINTAVGRELSFYRVSFHSMPLFVQCVLNKDGKITRFAIGD